MKKAPDWFKKNHPVKHLTGFKVGGTCKYYSPVRTVSELRETIQFARSRTLPFFILGRGSNVLIDDAHFNGVVIQLTGALAAIHCDVAQETITAGGGAPLPELGRQIAGRGVVSCAYMAVIPGSVGGAVRMNAGISATQQIQNDFLRALVYNPDADALEIHSRDDMCFQYRQSALSTSRNILVAAAFHLPAGKKIDAGQARMAIANLQKLRRQSQPKHGATCGSVFKNPAKALHAAGWYLEKAGLKGQRLGGAMVATEHANWIVNTSSATSTDIRQLIAFCQEKVSKQFGIALEREVVFLPDDIEIARTSEQGSTVRQKFSEAFEK